MLTKKGKDFLKNKMITYSEDFLFYKDKDQIKTNRMR